MEQRLTPEIQFAQHLSSNLPKIRDTAVKKLAKWFKVRSSSGKQFSPEEILKIWKGLFYCMWMSDKPLVQEKLADKISEMIHCFGQPASVYVFIDLFFQTMAREWFGIDRYRIEKFMMFVRRFLRQSFRFLKQQQWKPKPVRNFLLVITTSVLNATCEKTPSSLKIHVADVYLEELAKVSEKDFKTKKLIRFLEPWCKFLVEATDPVLMRSVSKSVFVELVEREEPLFPFKIKYDLIASLLLRHASKEGVKKINRKEMYKLVAIYKDAARGILPSARVIVDDDDIGRAIEKKDIAAAARRYLNIQEEVKKEREKSTKAKKERLNVENDTLDSSDDEEARSDGASNDTSSNKKKRDNKKRVKVVNEIRDVVGRTVTNGKLGDAERKTRTKPRDKVNKNIPTIKNKSIRIKLSDKANEDIPTIKNKSIRIKLLDKVNEDIKTIKNKSICKTSSQSKTNKISKLKFTFSDKDLPGKSTIKNTSICKTSSKSKMNRISRPEFMFSNEDLPGKSMIKNTSICKTPSKFKTNRISKLKFTFSPEDLPGKSTIENKSICKISPKSKPNRLKFTAKNKKRVHLPKFTITPRSQEALKLPQRDNSGFVVTPQLRGKDGLSASPISPPENSLDAAVKSASNLTTALQWNSKTSARAVYSLLEKDQKPLTTDSSENNSVTCNIVGTGDGEPCDVVISIGKPKTVAAELGQLKVKTPSKRVSFASFEHFVSAPPAFFRRSASKLKTKSQSPVGILKKSLNYSI